MVFPNRAAPRLPLFHRNVHLLQFLYRSPSSASRQKLPASWKPPMEQLPPPRRSSSRRPSSRSSPERLLPRAQPRPCLNLRIPRPVLTSWWPPRRAILQSWRGCAQRDARRPLHRPLL